MPAKRAREPKPTLHEKCVNAWLAKHDVRNTYDERMPTFLLVGLRTIWDRARPSLGAVMLTAIFERVIGVAQSRHAELARVGLRVHDRSSIEMLAPAAFTPEIGRAVPFTLAELLDVLDRLTAQTLTPVLHRALLAASIDGAGR
jgi:hypothetical protein